jgi:hypothetical protein
MGHEGFVYAERDYSHRRASSHHYSSLTFYDHYSRENIVKLFKWEVVPMLN